MDEYDKGIPLEQCPHLLVHPTLLFELCFFKPDSGHLDAASKHLRAVWFRPSLAFFFGFFPSTGEITMPSIFHCSPHVGEPSVVLLISHAASLNDVRSSVFTRAPVASITSLRFHFENSHSKNRWLIVSSSRSHSVHYKFVVN